MGLPIVGLGVRLVANGIGVASEVVGGSKNKSKDTEASSTTISPSISNDSKPSLPPPYTPDDQVLQSSSSKDLDTKDGSRDAMIDLEDDDSDISDDQDETHWCLDEAAADISPTTFEDPKKKYGFDAQPTIESLSALVLSKCPPPPYEISPLPQPVILPQRRPGQKDRGFIRAYAPVLQANGIPQDTFLAFVKTLHTASQASPLLNVIYLSAGVAGFVPHGAAMITSAVVQAAVGAAIELQKRQRANTFLDDMNDKLFKPRGLYALVMTYNPNAAKCIDARSMDVSELVSKRDAQDATTLGKFKLGSGEAYGDLQMPEAAALVFPALDEAEASGAAEQDGRLKKSKKLLANYYDNRAQAIYSKRYPDSMLKLPDEQTPKFASRFSDPNDPIHNGSLIALVTGGKVNPDAGKAERKAAKREAKSERKEIRREAKGRAPRDGRAKHSKKKGMKKNVLYLMVVNMPTAEELETAQQKLIQADDRRQ